MHSDALASVPRAITALIYQHRSLPSARQFVHSYFLSRQIDLQSMIKFVDPKKALLEMVQKFGREKPVSRSANTLLSLVNNPYSFNLFFSDCSRRLVVFPILPSMLLAFFQAPTSLVKAMEVL